eukprot:TRINITY_DN43572_c0_g1_i1.p1 TRINITY_DN43572_c0_g1~~TRINITY_DN43572_c0_g1_i1.p1  ORF type:complete len:601 (+),score=84.71 TRINITY_DN43572_c0_g1_i1:187-1989(+)
MVDSLLSLPPGNEFTFRGRLLSLADEYETLWVELETLRSVRLHVPGQMRGEEKQAVPFTAIIPTEHSRDSSRDAERGSSCPGGRREPIVDPNGMLSSQRLCLLRTQNKSGKVDSSVSTVKKLVESLTREKIGRSLSAIEGAECCPRQLAKSIANSMVFKVVAMFTVIGNAIQVGIDIDMEAKMEFRNFLAAEVASRTQAELVVHRITLAFLLWLVFEVTVRILAEGRQYIFGKSRFWNILDLIVALQGCVTQSIILFELSSSASPVKSLSFVRILRVLRLVNLVSVVQNVQSLKNLRTMVFAVLNSFVSLLWALIMLAMTMFGFAIVFQNGVINFLRTAHPRDDRKNAQEIQVVFGSLYETVIHLFSAVTGGNDWMFYGELLRKLGGDLYFLLFGFYIAFMLIGFLNVVTGIFVDRAVMARTVDEVVEDFKAEQTQTVNEVRRIFKSGDKDGSGTMTFAELQAHLEEPWVRAYFSGLNMEPYEAISMFTLLDLDESGEVGVDEFIHGCLRLKGNARSIDIFSLMYDNAKFIKQFTAFSSMLQQQLKDVKDVVNGLPSACSGEEMHSRDRTYSHVKESKVHPSSLCNDASNVVSSRCEQES